MELNKKVNEAIARGYQSLEMKDLKDWVTKACSPDNEPPKSKHVRRVLLALMRDKNLSPYNVCKFVMSDKSWREDRRIGAKLLHLILIVFQRFPLNHDMNKLTKGANAINRVYVNTTASPQEGFNQMAQILGSVIHSKRSFQKEFCNVMPNFFFNQMKPVDPSCAEKLETHLTTICMEAKRGIGIWRQTGNFAFLVLLHPVIEEVSNGYPYLKEIDSERSVTALAECEDIMLQCQQIPHLKTSIMYVKGEAAFKQ